MNLRKQTRNISTPHHNVQTQYLLHVHLHCSMFVVAVVVDIDYKESSLVQPSVGKQVDGHHTSEQALCGLEKIYIYSTSCLKST